jgi:hypothetical protein
VHPTWVINRAEITLGRSISELIILSTEGDFIESHTDQEQVNEEGTMAPHNPKEKTYNRGPMETNSTPVKSKGGADQTGEEKQI